jgi:hypothetical protein
VGNFEFWSNNPRSSRHRHQAFMCTQARVMGGRGILEHLHRALVTPTSCSVEDILYTLDGKLHEIEMPTICVLLSRQHNESNVRLANQCPCCTDYRT